MERVSRVSQLRASLSPAYTSGSKIRRHDKGAVLGADGLRKGASVGRNIPDPSVFPHCSQLNTPRLCKEMLTLKKR